MRPATSARRARLATIAASIALLGVVIGTGTASAAPPADQGRHIGANVAAAKGGKGPLPLIDHGGQVLLHSNVYLIFWGDFSTVANDEPAAMQSLFGGFNGSAYLALGQQYMRSGTTISTSYLGFRNDPSAPPSHAPNPAALGTEAQKAFGSVQADALYVVFTSNLPHVNYCAWHSATSVNGTSIEVAYVPLQPSGCSPLGTTNLHANTYSTTTQAAADSAAHEFIETVTDPKLNAWYDGNGAEIADKCEYDYQKVVTLHNGSTWQIQSEWSNATMSCQPG
ncbi:MAG: hypothetical protein QOI92_1805 [Chloroflexota bacterium]|nr:hypothetical protein [Chloroflexota bacterium]